MRENVESFMKTRDVVQRVEVAGAEVYENSGKLTKSYGKSPFLMGKSTISMAIFNCYVKLPEGAKILAVLIAFCFRFSYCGLL